MDILEICAVFEQQMCNEISFLVKSDNPLQDELFAAVRSVVATIAETYGKES